LILGDLSHRDLPAAFVIAIRVLALVRGVPWVLTYSDFFARLRVVVALARVVVFFAVDDFALVEDFLVVVAFLVVVDLALAAFDFAAGFALDLSGAATVFLAGGASATSSNETRWAMDRNIPRTEPESAFSTVCPILRRPKVRNVARCAFRVPIGLRVCLISNMVV